MSDKPISDLRRRMIADMTVRSFSDKTQHDYIRHIETFALVGLRPTVGLVSRTGMVPLNSVRDTAGAMARSVSDMAILLDVIVGPDPEDVATTRAEGHRLPTYSGALKNDALKGAHLGVLRQIFKPATTDPRIIAHFEMTARLASQVLLRGNTDLPMCPRGSGHRLRPLRRAGRRLRLPRSRPTLPLAHPTCHARPLSWALEG